MKILLALCLLLVSACGESHTPFNPEGPPPPAPAFPLQKTNPAQECQDDSCKQRPYTQTSGKKTLKSNVGIVTYNPCLTKHCPQDQTNEVPDNYCDYVGCK